MPTVTVQCKADTYIGTGLAIRDEYNNTATNMWIHRSRDTSSFYMGLMQFDIPALPNKEIVGAELKAHCSKKGKLSTITAVQYNISVNVDTLTGRQFENKYMGSDVAESPTQVTTTNTVYEVDEWFTWDILGIVKNALGLTNVCIALVDLAGKASSNDSGWNFNTIETTYKPYITITYTDAVPSPPTILYPNGDLIEKGNSIRFSWKYNSLYDSGQTKFVIEWRQQGNITWTSQTIASSNEYFTMDSSLFPTGIIEWRVKTYNVNNAVSAYSTGTFELSGRPASPVIVSMKNDAISEITWRSNEAETAVYRLWIYQGSTLIHESGDMPGGLSNTYIPNKIFNNGTYTVKMRIGSAYGVWSDESAKVFTITASVPVTPTITLSAATGGVLITTSSTIEDKIVYRSDDGINFAPIARFSGLMFTDYTVKSNVLYQYFIRVHNGGFSDSKILSVKIKYKGALISEVNTLSNFMQLYKSDKDWFNNIKISHSNEAEMVEYQGRSYPVKEAGIHRETKLSMLCYLDNTEIKKFEEIYRLNGIYLFRSSEESFCCEINGLSYENTLFNQGKNVEISLSRLDHSLEVRFDV
mgnify:CR=1 FL=1